MNPKTEMAVGMDNRHEIIASRRMSLMGGKTCLVGLCFAAVL